MSSSELDKYDYYMLNTEDKYYEVVESNTEDFMTRRICCGGCLGGNRAGVRSSRRY